MKVKKRGNFSGKTLKRGEEEVVILFWEKGA